MKYLKLVAIFLFVSFAAKAQTTYYVDAGRPDNTGSGTSWSLAKRDLQIAINLAASGDAIWVRSGTYFPTHDPFGSTSPANNRDKTFTLKNGVKIYGGFSGTETVLSERKWKQHLTILSGDLGVLNNISDNAYHVVLSVNLNNATVLDGVIVTAGNATAVGNSSIVVSGRTITRYKGGGIYNTNSATGFFNCTVRFNSADCSNGAVDALGAGMFNELCTSAISHCIFDGNFFPAGGASFSVYGAGMMISGGSCAISNTVFINNNGGSGFFNGSSGGGLYIGGGSSSIDNTIFYNNSSQNGAAVQCGGGQNNTSVFTNCSFVSNTSAFAGTGFSGFAKASIRNCIFWNNAPTSSSVSGRNEIYSQETNAANMPVFANCIIRDAAGSPLGITNTVLNSCSNSNPLFVNMTDADGPDNLILTADDGIRLQCGSPAINTGANPATPNDILGLPRIGNPDMGAFEGNHISSDVNPIPTTNTVIQLSQNASGVTYYSDCFNKVLQIQSGGAFTLAGTVTSKVWIESVQPAAYVKRHYEIVPATLPETSSGRVTLYFRQQEFNDFNAINVLKLPAGPADAGGIANMRIEKRSGESGNGTGLIETYSGTNTTIPNGSLSIVWNATATRWEVSFNTTGFGGFFLKTQTTILPLTLISLSGVRNDNCTRLSWLTADETNSSHFEIEKKQASGIFEMLGNVTARGSGSESYEFTDCSNITQIHIYRLKMVDKDGAYTYSKELAFRNKVGASAKIYPNPATNYVLLDISDQSLLNSMLSIHDMAGKLIKNLRIDRLVFSIDITGFIPGMYTLTLANGDTFIFLKQNS